MFKLEFKTASAVFAETDAGREVTRILCRVAADIVSGAVPLDLGGYIRDANGDTVGQWEYTPQS